MNVITGNVSAPADNFWNALKIYYEQPKSLNKEVLFSQHLLSMKFQSNAGVCNDLYNELCSKFEKGWVSLDEFKSFINLQFKSTKVVDIDSVFDDSNNVYLLIRKLIPKLFNNNLDDFYEIFIIDKTQLKVYIFTQHLESKECPEDLAMVKHKKRDPYIVLKFSQIELHLNNSSLKLTYKENISEKGVNWLKVVFIPKFIKLLANNINNNEKIDGNKLFVTSQVNIVQYYQLYEQMKKKYAKNLIDNWTENTDAKKFVHEDIGIATYLLLLWNGGTIPEKEAKKQKFVDLGCGNGLLVHILNSEGHLGVGLDLRRRKIWDIYSSLTILKEEAVIPSIDTVYPEADWLIGNHSDELTAWIPIMAKRSNKFCQYFVLPCCPYQLNGKKFQRKNCGLSSYQDFIAYVKSISELCGYETYVDKLRIPSTKRICLVGMNKKDQMENRISLTEKIVKFVQQETDIVDNNKANEEFEKSNSHPQVKIRDSVEAVRNCTKLPQSLIDKLLIIIMKALLKDNCIYEVKKENTIHDWNRGGKLSVSDLAKTISEDLLKQLKKECKGLQTLLKNHHFIFEVHQGYVQFRSPETLLQLSNKFLVSGDKSKWKNRKCWFYKNHPDKCPLTDELCSYCHDE